jgi:hypothetical protein
MVGRESTGKQIQATIFPYFPLISIKRKNLGTKILIIVFLAFVASRIVELVLLLLSYVIFS